MKNILLLSLTVISFWSCAKSGFQQGLEADNDYSNELESIDEELTSNHVVIPGGDPNFNPQPLAWESKVAGSAAWSKSIYTIIKNEEPQMLGQNVADDIELFCPKYRSLTDNQRLNFWGQLFAGIAKYESGWKPTSRMVERTMGIDPVTRRQVASEGLLQLSYQDETSYRLDCGFDWNKDKNLSISDPKKTIFDPVKNLRCGIKIMARQLKNKRSITLRTGVYWAVIRTGGRYTQINGIAAVTKTLKFCK